MTAGPPAADPFERWEEIDPILARALELEPEEREPFLDRACAGDEELRSLVERMLRSGEGTGLDFEGVEVLAAFVDELGTAGSAPSGPGEGDCLGPWRILEELGRGGMAVVHLAERTDPGIQQRVALKRLRTGTESREARLRFEQERQILALLEHPGIARLIDGGIDAEGRPYLAMELVDGEPITDSADRRCLDVDARLELFVSVAAAVQYAHRHLIVHRDIKPSNILVDRSGRVRLLDFGIAKLLEPERYAAAAPETRTLWRPMTPEYACPEQVRGRAITTSSDIYQLGLLLYELLTGRRAQGTKPGSSLAELERTVCDEPPARPSNAASEDDEGVRARTAAARGTTPDRLRRRLAGDLDNIVLKALQKEPDRRYASVEQLIDDIGRHRSGRPVSARPDSLLYRSRKFLGRHRVAASVAIAVGLLVVFFLVRLTEERRAARREAAKATQVADFLGSLFEASDPWQARGEDLRARELLDRGAARIADELGDQPELQAELMTLIGRIYQRLGDLEAARPLLAGAEERYRSAGSARLATSLIDLGALAFDSGEYEVARGHYVEALALQDAAGAEPLERSDTVNALGVLAWYEGDQTEALARFREVLAAREAAFEPGHTRIADAYNNLALVRRERGELDQARARLEQAIAIYRAADGGDHPVLANTEDNLATVLKESGDLPGARRHLERALEIYERTLPPDHPDLGMALSNFGNLLVWLGETEEARRVFERAIAAQRESLGPDHPDLALSRRNLGNLLERLGETGEARRHFEEALRVFEAALGPDHREVAHTLASLGRVEAESGELATGHEMLLRSLATYERGFGSDDPILFSPLVDLGLVEVEQGAMEEARARAARAREIASTGLGTEPLGIARSLLDFGRLLRQLGDLEEASDQLRQSLDSLRRLLPSPNELTAEVLLELGSVQAERGACDEAESLLRAGLRESSGFPPAIPEARTSACPDLDPTGPLDAPAR